MGAKADPGLAVRALLSLVAGFRALRLDVDGLLRGAGIEASLLGEPEARIPHGAAMRLWELAESASGDRAIGLHVAESAPLPAFDVHAYAILSSPTLREGYLRGSRYQRLVHDATTLTLTGGDPAVLRHALPGGRAVPRQPAEFLLAVYARLGRAAAGVEWAPLEVRLAHVDPSNRSELVRFFRAPVRFATGENSLLLQSALLDAANPRSDPGLLAILDRYATGLLANRTPADTASDAVRAHLSDALAGGEVSSVATARALGFGVRTLARRLSSEGTSHGQLLDQLRRERAAALLAQGRSSIAETAFLLGFSELSSFYRAFHRWTGLTPAAYRRGLAAGRRVPAVAGKPGAKGQTR